MTSEFTPAFADLVEAAIYCAVWAVGVIVGRFV